MPLGLIDISFGCNVYFKPKNIDYKKLVNGVTDQFKISFIDRDSEKMSSNFRRSIVLTIV